MRVFPPKLRRLLHAFGRRGAKGNRRDFLLRRRARDPRGGLETSITSVDPEPRREVDALCQHTIRRPLEEVDVAVFDNLQPGDIVFMDGSHRVFTNSDSTVFFLDILPRLGDGVVVGIHDIFLPFDYPPNGETRSIPSNISSRRICWQKLRSSRPFFRARTSLPTATDITRDSSRAHTLREPPARGIGRSPRAWRSGSR
jgi:hypothetical protein